MGPLYPRERELEVKENAIVQPSNAPNVFQWNLLTGLQGIVGSALQVINVLPVGTWKHAYKKCILPDNDWSSDGIVGHEIGCINLPFVKQWMRCRKAKKILRTLEDDAEIIIYSAYMPFLRAVYRLPRNRKVTAIITDLPEFYDLGKTSALRRKLRSFQNKMIYKYLERVDRFVVLTEQMKEPLKIGDRPWICVEGICDIKQTQEIPAGTSEKKVIFYSGTLHYQYGIKNLLDAFEMLEDDNLELWICGSGEAEEEIIRLSETDERIKFYGFCTQDEVAKLRAQATVLVNPRENKGDYVKYSFPSKTMEYMASGKPLVMYKLDGIPKEYDPFINYPRTEIRIDLAKMIKDICMDETEIYRKKAQDAQKFVLEHKNPKVQASKVINLLNDSANDDRRE